MRQYFWPLSDTVSIACLSSGGEFVLNISNMSDNIVRLEPKYPWEKSPRSRLLTNTVSMPFSINVGGVNPTRGKLCNHPETLRALSLSEM